MAFPAGVFTQCQARMYGFHPVFVPRSICRAVGGVVRLLICPLSYLFLAVCPLGLAKAAEVSKAGSQCGCLGLLALSVLPSHPASVGAAGGPGPCLSARGLGFYVTGPKLGSQGIKCPLLCDHAESSHAASCKLFKGLWVFCLGDAAGDGDEDKEVPFQTAKTDEGNSLGLWVGRGARAHWNPFLVSTSTAPLASPCQPPQTLTV